jgi:hypothetical protein
MAPSDTERMSSRVRVGLVPLVGIEIGNWLEKSGSESHRLFMCCSGVINMEIEVNLLWVAVGPVRRNVVRCELHADPPLAGGVNDAVPAIVHEDSPTEHSGPERALRGQVGCIEHDHLTDHPHRRDCTDRTMAVSESPKCDYMGDPRVWHLVRRTWIAATPLNEKTGSDQRPFVRRGAEGRGLRARPGGAGGGAAGGSTVWAIGSPSSHCRTWAAVSFATFHG